MVEQTKWCVSKLRDAGLKRSDFRARVTRNSKGEYGSVDICLFIPTQDALKFVDALAKYFKVVLYKIDGIVCSVTIEDNRNTGIVFVNCK